jgi:hypothetical protein
VGPGSNEREILSKPTEAMNPSKVEFNLYCEVKPMVSRLENEQSPYPQNPDEVEQVKRDKGPQQGKSSVQPDAPKDGRPKTSPEERTEGRSRRRE